jgi:hypothetical protein
MNAVEIEEAVSKLVEAPFDAAEFPFAFLEAFGNKETTLKRLRTGNTNQSDVGGLLQRGNIHVKVAPAGQVAETLAALRASPATGRQKAKFVLATDGQELQAEQLVGDVPPLACEYKDLPNHFAFFLPLAGITTVRAIAENAFDIRATGRLNRLYVELLKTNPDWDTDARREALNHFFARLIFCFFAEDTGIFDGTRLFTGTVEQMTDRDGSNTHEVLAKLFEAMNTPRERRAESDLPPSALKFPYVNGDLFSGSVQTPRFSKIARSYLIFVGGLDWKLINPDIFGSMIQAVADDEERGALGMHYTSVPNILKVLNPLFLDDLRQKLAEAGEGTTPASKGQLKRLRDRLARIRVFDPACGSGNFLVIAYKEMRQIEAVINERRNERELASVIPMTNFRGIEIRHFAAEIARLALIIAKFQCDTLHISHLFARGQVIPLKEDNWITCGNALRLDWLQICPPTGMGVKVAGDDLFNTPLDQAEIDFENAGGETFLCGNPPYLGTRNQTREQKEDAERVLGAKTASWASLDYVCSWLINAARYLAFCDGAVAFVTTKSICQGSQVPALWRVMLGHGCVIDFAHAPFTWNNLAAHNAGVTVIVIGFSRREQTRKRIFTIDSNGEVEAREVAQINSYLVPAPEIFIEARDSPISDLPAMDRGSAPTDDGNLVFEYSDYKNFIVKHPPVAPLFRRAVGGSDFVRGNQRFAIYIRKGLTLDALQKECLAPLADKVSAFRKRSPKSATKSLADQPLAYGEDRFRKSEVKVFVPQLLSGNREYVATGIFPGDVLTVAPHFDIPTQSLVPVAILGSKLHLVWVSTVCGKFKTDYRYSNTLGWNTFPVPPLSDRNKADLTQCAEEILLAREAHFPATIAELYDPEHMPADLRAAHDRNDETLERIYIGRQFKNDTERLEKLFELYTQMTAKQATAVKEPKPPGKRAKKGA